MAIRVNKLERPGKGPPPASARTKNKLVKPPAGKTVTLQVNIDPEVKREFRVYAVEHDIDMSHLFVAMWRYYKDHHG